MPAISPAQLKIQINQLVEKVDNSNEFARSLNSLMESYSDRVRKPGYISSRDSLINSYQVPQQVIRQIKNKLKPVLSINPDKAIPIVDALWQEKWLEFKLLALEILGWIPPVPPENIINRLNLWSDQNENDYLLDSGFARSLVRLWEENIDLFFNFLKSWLEITDGKKQKMVLRMIPIIVSDQRFDNLPIIIQLLSPFVEHVDLIPASDLVQAVKALALRSPQETSYFLKRAMINTENDAIKVLIRQIIDAFPDQVRKEFRTYLKKL